MTEPKTLTIQDLRHNLGKVITDAQHAGQRTIITRNGQPVAAIVSVDDLTRFVMLDRTPLPDIDTDVQNRANLRASTNRFLDSIAARDRLVR